MKVEQTKWNREVTRIFSKNTIAIAGKLLNKTSGRMSALETCMKTEEIWLRKKNGLLLGNA